MQYKPHRKLKPLVIVCFTLLVIVLAFWILSYLKIGPNGVNQLGVLVFLTALVYLLVRYALTDFVYQLSEKGDVFTVTKVGGKLPRTVADIRLSPCDRVIPYGKDVCKKEGIRQTENYCVSLFPEERWMLVTEINGKTVGLILECQADTAALIRNGIAALPTEGDAE